MLIQCSQLGRRIGDRWLFQDLTLSVRAGDRIGIVGPNGAGKSTLLRCLAGDDSPDEGQLSRPRETRIGILRQEIDPSLDPDLPAELLLEDLSVPEEGHRRAKRTRCENFEGA